MRIDKLEKAIFRGNERRMAICLQDIQDDRASKREMLDEVSDTTFATRTGNIQVTAPHALFIDVDYLFQCPHISMYTPAQIKELARILIAKYRDTPDFPIDPKKVKAEADDEDDVQVLDVALPGPAKPIEIIDGDGAGFAGINNEVKASEIINLEKELENAQETVRNAKAVRDNCMAAYDSAKEIYEARLQEMEDIQHRLAQAASTRYGLGGDRKRARRDD